MNDVKTKQIHYADRGRTASIFGVFKGTLIGNTDDQEYEVRVDNSLPPFSRLHGLPPGLTHTILKNLVPSLI